MCSTTYIFKYAQCASLNIFKTSAVVLKSTIFLNNTENAWRQWIKHHPEDVVVQSYLAREFEGVATTKLLT